MSNNKSPDESPTKEELERMMDELAVEYYDMIGDHERAAIIWCDIKEKPCQP